MKEHFTELLEQLRRQLIGMGAEVESQIRVAVEERSSLSPDALTGMEASLRFPGAETCDSKIFGRLTAWACRRRSWRRRRRSGA